MNRHSLPAAIRCAVITPLLFSASRLFAGILVEQTTANIHGDGRTPGQSFTAPADGTADALTEVDFGKGYTSIPSGHLYLLGQEYLGRPQDLSTATPGFLALSDATTTTFDLYAKFSFAGANQYALQPGIKYWVYGDSGTGWDLNWTDHDAYPAGNLYMALPGQAVDNTYGGSAYPTTIDYQFSVLANPAAVPEASSWLFGMFPLAAGAFLRRHPRAALGLRQR